MKIPEELTVYSYPGLITQVISNLLINSLKHAFPNTDRGNILIEAGKSGDGINLVFSDNGCGIPEEQHEKNFESFFTTARDSGGSGLGLYLVRDIVENQLNGSLLLDSRPGKGTRFIITIST
jgi:signal transduction histidine kinase